MHICDTEKLWPCVEWEEQIHPHTLLVVTEAFLLSMPLSESILLPAWRTANGERRNFPVSLCCFGAPRWVQASWDACEVLALHLLAVTLIQNMSTPSFIAVSFTRSVTSRTVYRSPRPACLLHCFPGVLFCRLQGQSLFSESIGNQSVRLQGQEKSYFPNKEDFSLSMLTTDE